MRTLVEVVNQMLEVIPESETDIRDRLTARIRSIEYKAPELRYNLWFDVAADLEKHLGPPDTGWKQKVQAIFAGKEEAPDAAP